MFGQPRRSRRPRQRVADRRASSTFRAIDRRRPFVVDDARARDPRSASRARFVTNNDDFTMTLRRLRVEARASRSLQTKPLKRPSTPSSAHHGAPPSVRRELAPRTRHAKAAVRVRVLARARTARRRRVSARHRRTRDALLEPVQATHERRPARRDVRLRRPRRVGGPARVPRAVRGRRGGRARVSAR